MWELSLKIANIFYEYSVDLLRTIYSHRFSDTAILDSNKHFPYASDFLNNWVQIRNEALDIARDLSIVPRFHEIMPQQADISDYDKRDWRMFIIKAYGVTIQENSVRCPVLSKLIKAHPEVLSASFSFLAPGKHIPIHRGPFRGITRYYLGLSVPTGADGLPGTTLTLDGKDYRLGNGDALLWDDTFEHEVRNETKEVRIALLLDVKRKGMPLDMEILSRALILIAGFAVKLKAHLS